ncbi:MAG: proteasome accessory factor PafA2 family protein, partial [Actinomycetes bacterium]
MTIRRVMGIETEYGIAVPGDPQVNPVLISSQIVNGYATGEPGLSHARWDYEEENPLRDARGFTMARDVADASQLTDDDVGLANVILTNGARLYVDHAHPEYSSPEVTSPRDVLKWDKAGEHVMAKAAQ